MGWTFRMVFEGVCAFVPDTPLYEQQGNDFVPARTPPRRMTVLLPDLQQAQIVPVQPPTVRASHLPLLLFRQEDWRPESDRFLDLKVRVPSADLDKGVLVLQGDAIELVRPTKGNGTNGYALKPVTTVGKAPLPTAADRRSLWWVPRVAEITGVSTKLEQKFLPTHGQPLAAEVVAAVTFDSGHLYTQGFNAASSTTQEPAIWTFSEPGNINGRGTWNRAVGNRIAVEFGDLTDAFELKFTRFVEGHPIESKALFAPPAGSRRDVVEVVVANAEPEKLFEEKGLFRPPQVGMQDVDFNVFYELLGQQSGPLPTRAAGMTAFGPDTKPCAPGFI